MRRSVSIVVAVGGITIIIAVALTLSERPLELIGSSVRVTEDLSSATSQAHLCVSRQAIPRGTTAIRVDTSASVGPKMTVSVKRVGRVIATSRIGSGWSGRSVTAPINGLRVGADNATVCVSAYPNGYETLGFEGGERRAEGVGRPKKILGLEYLAPAHRTWWSQAGEVARRMGLGRAAGGTWNALLVLALMLAVATACCGVLLKELR